MIKKIREFFAKEKKLLEQIIYEVFYRIECPLCKKFVEDKNRIYKDDIGEEIKKSLCAPTLLMECPTCHIALYGKLIRIDKIIKKYEEDDDGPLDVKLASEERVPLK